MYASLNQYLKGLEETIRIPIVALGRGGYIVSEPCTWNHDTTVDSLEICQIPGFLDQGRLRSNLLQSHHVQTPR